MHAASDWPFSWLDPETACDPGNSSQLGRKATRRDKGAILTLMRELRPGVLTIPTNAPAAAYNFARPSRCVRWTDE